MTESCVWIDPDEVAKSLTEAGIPKDDTDYIADMLHEGQIEMCGDLSKKKRKPSEYNLFIGKCIEVGPRGGGRGAVRERWCRCVAAWKHGERDPKQVY